MAAGFTNRNVGRLAALCYHLQRLKGEARFGVGRHQAAELLGVTHTSATKYFNVLIRAGFLVEPARGSRDWGGYGTGRVRQYRFVESPNRPA